MYVKAVFKVDVTVTTVKKLIEIKINKNKIIKLKGRALKLFHQNKKKKKKNSREGSRDSIISHQNKFNLIFFFNYLHFLIFLIQIIFSCKTINNQERISPELLTVTCNQLTLPQLSHSAVRLFNKKLWNLSLLLSLLQFLGNPLFFIQGNIFHNNL